MKIIFFCSLKRQLLKSKGISILLLIGVVICILCISIMLGAALGAYKISTTVNSYSTIVMDIGNETKWQVQDLSNSISDLSKNRILNVLYMTKMDQNKYIIGWEGTGGSNWFPITSGRFFTEKEQQNGDRVFFCSNAYRNKHINEESSKIGEHTYDLIGTGWIVAHNFLTAVPSQSAGGKILAHEAVEESNLDVQIIPFICYEKEFSPFLVLIQVNGMTHSQLEKLSVELNNKYKDSVAYPTDKNSDNVLIDEQVRFGIYGITLCIIAGATLLRVFCEWVKRYYYELYVFYLCGLSRIKCISLIYGHWLLLYFTGSLLALGIHYLILPFLKGIYADSMPIPSTVCILCLFIFIVSILLTAPGIANVMKFEKKRDQL